MVPAKELSSTPLTFNNLTQRKGNLFLLFKIFLIALAGSLLFIPFLGRVHLFDWDEINFAECAREMIVTKNWLQVQIDFLPFWEKPPLFIWFQVISMKCFGITGFAARFPNAICGVFTLILLFLAGRRWFDELTGWIWVIVYLTALLPFIYFKSGIIDPWFNFFIFSSILCVISIFTETPARNNSFLFALSAFLLGLAVLTKGPAALIIWFLTVMVYLMIKRFRIKLRLKDVLLFLVILLFTGGAWFLFIMIKGNPDLIIDFLRYQATLFTTSDGGHGGPIFYHIPVLLFGLFPSSLYFILAFRRNSETLPTDKNFRIWMIILFFVVLVLFSIVKTKIIHYSSMCYLPMTCITALTIRELLRNAKPVPAWITGITLVFFLIFGLVLITVPFPAFWKPLLIPLMKDEFALHCIQAPVYWSSWDIIPGVILLAGAVLLFFTRKQRARIQLLITGFVMGGFILSSVLIYPSRAEQYSQRALINFCTSLKGKNCYFKSVTFKSYAPLYYGEKRSGENGLARYDKWLLAGNTDKPCFFIIKNNQLSGFLDNKYPGIKFVYSRNGYCVLFRDKPSTRLTRSWTTYSYP